MHDLVAKTSEAMDAASALAAVTEVAACKANAAFVKMAQTGSEDCIAASAATMTSQDAKFNVNAYEQSKALCPTPRRRRRVCLLVKRLAMRWPLRSDLLGRPSRKHRRWLRTQSTPYSLLRRPWRRQSSPMRQRRPLGHGHNGGGRVVQGRSGGHSVLRTPAPSREDLESQAVADVAMRACMAAVLELTACGY